ncbi:MAG: RNA polymerase sigma factor [Anaerolineales bacterium]
MTATSQTLSSQRENDDWLADLRADGAVREVALADLRAILLDGLRRGLVNWVNTAGPEFEPLADDFVQEAMLKILDKLDTFRGESMFTTWSHKIAVRVALNELRRKRWKDFSLEGMLDDPRSGAAAAAAIADPAPDPEQATERSDMVARVLRVVDEELTDRQRLALVATQVQGVSMTVVADQLGTNRNALYKLIHDARVRLKRRLNEEGLTPDAVLAVFER